VNFSIFGGGPATGSEVRENTAFGVLRLVLHPTGYDWNFLAASGNAFSDSGSQSCRGAFPDVDAPSPPGALTATANGPTRVDLSWAASTDNVGVSGYEVWRGPATGAMAVVASTAGVGFADTGVAAGTRYRYQVRAVDAAGNASALSNVGVVATPARRGALLARFRLKAASARRALARGRIRIAARRWAPTVVEVRVGGRLAAGRTLRSRRAVTLKLASWSKQRRYRHRAVTVTLRRPAA
jgi:hypothetical protein